MLLAGLLLVVTACGGPAAPVRSTPAPTVTSPDPTPGVTDPATGPAVGSADQFRSTPAATTSTAGHPPAPSTARSSTSDPTTSLTTSPTTSPTTGPRVDPVTTAPPTSAATPSAGALPTVALAGVNDPGCRSADPPVVLLHGTLQRTADAYATLAPVVRASGRCLYALDYGNGGIGAVRTSADAFAALVTTVRRLTGAASVDVIAYSQGGLVLRTALRDDGLADQVGVAVLLAPAFHGTTSLAGNVPALLCAACTDLAAGSSLIKALDAGGDLDGSVRYAVVSTRLDTVVTPVSSQVPRGPADRVRSVVVEDVCPSDQVDHVHLPADPGVIAWTVAALNTRGRPADDALTC